MLSGVLDSIRRESSCVSAGAGGKWRVQTCCALREGRRQRHAAAGGECSMVIRLEQRFAMPGLKPDRDATICCCLHGVGKPTLGVKVALTPCACGTQHGADASFVYGMVRRSMACNLI